MAVAVALGCNALGAGRHSLVLLPVPMLLVLVMVLTPLVVLVLLQVLLVLVLALVLALALALALALTLMTPCNPPSPKQESGRAALVAMDVVIALLTVAAPVQDSQRTRVDDAVRPAIDGLYMYRHVPYYTTPCPFVRLLWAVCERCWMVQLIIDEPRRT